MVAETFVVNDFHDGGEDVVRIGLVGCSGVDYGVKAIVSAVVVAVLDVDHSAFVEQHRARLEEILHTHGPGSRPASHGRYALIGQPETLVILERMESAPFLLRSQWEEELETVFLDDLEFVWGPRIRLSR